MSEHDDKLALGHYVLGNLCLALGDGLALGLLTDEQFSEVTKAERQAVEEGQEDAVWLLGVFEHLRAKGQGAE
jgi:hypothetical protein